MTTIINPPTSSTDSGISGTIISLFVVIVLGLIFFYFGIPALRQMGQSGAPQINVPNKIDVNVKQAP